MNLFKQKYNDQLYFLFRIVVGLMFLGHGGQKLFGWMGGNGVELMSLMGLAGVIELVGGILITLGVFTRLVAAIAAVEMLVAFFKMHVSQGWNPLMNGGELALLYFAAFLVMVAWGNGKLSLEKKLFKKERF
ncbi:MAG TPA: DoxX family protein [Candidatus Nanoarchaeia archaeon]|nr:DoxX family protein [Candidatus Nanoarchaeia archaeon]